MNAGEAYRTCDEITIRNGCSDLDNHITVFDMHRKGLGDIRPFLQFLAAFHRDRIGPDLDPVRVEPRLAITHIEFPTVPGATEHFADTRALVNAGLRRGQPRHACGFLKRSAFVRAAVQQREELAIDMEHDDVAARDIDDLVAAGRDVGGAGNDVTGHCWFQNL